MTLRSLSYGASRLLLTAGLVSLAYVAYVAVDTSAYQADQRRLFAEARNNPALTPASPAAGADPPRPAAAPLDGAWLGEIEIPRLGIDVGIVQGESPRLLERAAGHVQDTALPGEMGNVVLAAHRDSFFRPLEHVRTGDEITVTTLDGEFHYVVESTIVVGPGDLWVLAPIGGRTLTLITCFPFGFIGAAADRFVVRARETRVRD
jgi:sortase A